MHKVTIEIVSKHQNQEFKCQKTPHILFIHEKLVPNYAIKCLSPQKLWVCNLVTARFIWNILTGHCFFSPPNSLVSFISKTDGRNITNGHNITEILLTVRYHIHDQLETVFRIFVVVQDIFNKLKNQSRWFYGSGTIHVISSRISMSMV
jgi:hypothetical protein